MKKSLFIAVSICFVLVLGSASQIHAQSAAGITGLSLASIPAMTTVSGMMKGNPSAPVTALAILACMTARQTYSFRKGEVEIGNSD